ncbi:MAG: VWA domain-containing protein [Planctomycetes bacterium]|nr:VWA domain-containing protein [Planctomycetota bacterium]
MIPPLSQLGLRDPDMLWLALLVPAAWLLRRWLGAPAIDFAPFARLDGLPSTLRERLVALPDALTALGLLLVVAALARPVERVPLPLEIEGLDVLLVLDVSSSMAATDLDPLHTRLALAQDAAERFVEGRPHDRIGLLTFARFPDLRCPPTLDHRALGELLRRTTPVASDGPEDATGIGTALARASSVLSDSDAPSKVVVLLTDGEENVATALTPDEIAPLHAAQLAASLGVRVHVVSVGPHAARDATSSDTGQLERVAALTGGRLFEAADARALSAVWASIDALETAPRHAPRFRDADRFEVCAVAALLLLLAARALRHGPLEVLP